MEAPFSEDALHPRIARLSPRGRLAFLISCAERLVPNYDAFSREHRWGEPEVLREALECGWRELAARPVAASRVRRLLLRCEDVTPDTEDFDSGLVSAALDAAVVCALVLETMLSEDATNVVEAAALARDTVDLHVQALEAIDPADPLGAQTILAHPLMQSELRRQREDLELLEALVWSSAPAAELARRWRNCATSNIGRS